MQQIIREITINQKDPTEKTIFEEMLNILKRTQNTNTKSLCVFLILSTYFILYYFELLMSAEQIFQMGFFELKTIICHRSMKAVALQPCDKSTVTAPFTADQRVISSARCSSSKRILRSYCHIKMTVMSNPSMHLFRSL